MTEADRRHLGKPYLETAHVAHKLSTSTEFVRRLIRSRQLPAMRVGGIAGGGRQTHYRIDPVDLDAFIEKRRTIQFIRSTLPEGGRA